MACPGAADKDATTGALLLNARAFGVFVLNAAADVVDAWRHK